MKINEPAARLLQLTDLHILPGSGETMLGVDTERSFHAILDTALSRHRRVDLILLSGDLVQEPATPAYRKIASRLRSVPIPCVCLPGNHDDFVLMQQILNAGNISCRKQLFLNGWQIICLNSQVRNSDGGRINDSELAFLSERLIRHPDNPALIAVHHHIRKTGSEWMDTMMIDNSDELLAVANQNTQVKALICGHIHQAMDVDLGSLRFFGTPSTCFQFKPGSKTFALDDAAPGYRLIDLFSDGRIESSVYYLDEKLAGLQFSGRY